MAALLGLALMITVVAQADDVAALADQAGVDPTDLQGAVNSTGLEPREYLVMVGAIASPPKLPVTTWDSQPFPAVWLNLAYCESRGRWNINTGNGYYGGLQEDMTFWRNYGGLAYAPRPDLASPAAQVAVAQRGLARQGWGAWPACSRALRLR